MPPKGDWCGDGRGPCRNREGSSAGPTKRCRQGTTKRAGCEPASNPPPRKHPPANPDWKEDEAEAEAEPDWEEEDAISISLNDEEERLNLVSPLLTSKVTISVVNIWH